MDTLSQPAVPAPSNAASSKTSPSDPPLITALPVAGEPEEISLMRLQLHKAGIRTDGLDEAGVRTCFAGYRRQQADAVELAKADRERQALDALQEAELEHLRRRLSRRGIDAAAMTTAQMTVRLAELEAAEREQAAEVQRKIAADRRADRAKTLFEVSGCPKRHVVHLAEMDGYNAEWTRERDALVEQVGYSDGFLVALLGIRGNGKTELGVSVIQHATQRLLTARYIKAWNLFNRFREAFTPVAKGKAGENADDIIQEFVGYDVLVIDEAHQRAGTDYEQNSLINLLDLRYDAMGCTILIGNQTRADFAAAVGDSLVSRIHQTGEVIECNWPSYRKPIPAGQRSDAWKSRTRRPRAPRE